jgi:arginyl-tRNA synthetase
VIANWCIDMAQCANAFYRDVPVMDAPEGERVARLRLVRAAHASLAIAMSLLSIPVPEEM